MNLASRLDELSAQFPDKPAFIFSSKPNHWDTFTYKQLADLTNRLTRGLLACGLTPGTRAALMTPPSVEFFALAFAMLKTGIVPIITDPAIGLRKVTECLDESQPEIFIGNTLTHLLRVVFGWGKDSIRHNLTISSLLQITNYELLNANHSPLITDNLSLITDDSPAAIIYTSGSTGLPKGAIYTHENFAAQLDMLVRAFNIQPDEIDLPAFPLYALIDVLVGVTSVIPDIRFPVPGKVDAARTLSAIQQFKVTNTFASPVVLDRLANYGAANNVKLPSLKRVITAGAPAPFQVQENFKKLLPESACLFGVYGATETLPITVIEGNEVFKDTRHQTARGAGVCIGRPVDGADVRIIQISDGKIPNWDKSIELPATQIGEITVKGRAVTKEYVAREGANRLAKIRDGGEIIHRMGDVGYLDKQGRLWYCGRKSQRVETNYGTFFTEQIEGIFNEHPLVYRTALVGVGKEPVLWVELEAHAKNAVKQKIKNELIELAKDHPQAKMIKIFLFMKKFPTDVRHNSKIIREKLPQIANREFQ
ncbi:MAG: AMP-binding protein [Chloroflexi bacterium]|nr:AMP-binding protein [Chloroflexota bacterium]